MQVYNCSEIYLTSTSVLLLSSIPTGRMPKSSKGMPSNTNDKNLIPVMKIFQKGIILIFCRDSMRQRIIQTDQYEEYNENRTNTKVHPEK